jgi:hypothetical protein
VSLGRDKVFVMTFLVGVIVLCGGNRRGGVEDLQRIEIESQ